MTATAPGTIGALLRAALRAAGVAVVFGDPLDGLDVVPVPSAALAGLLARVERRVHGRPAATVHGRDLAVEGPDPATYVLQSADDVALVAERVAAHATSGLVLTLAIDLAAPAGRLAPAPIPPPEHWSAVPDEVMAAVEQAERPLVLAGPGVVAAGAVPGLHALAAAGHLGVLNTWGAKGVFDWRSRHHLATVGLQAQDFEAGGVPQADLVVATGLDPDESPARRWQLAPHVCVDPYALGSLAERWPRPAAWPAVPAIRAGLAEVTQQGWAAVGAPLTPSQATRNYATALGTVGRVAADAGAAGFWVARTFSTTTLGSAQVPSVDEPGFAAAVALVTRLRTPGRPVLAVVDGPLSEATHELLDLSDSLAAAFAVEVFTAGGDSLDAADHLARLGRLAVVERSEVVTVTTAAWQLDRIIEVAGPIVAWNGLHPTQGAP